MRGLGVAALRLGLLLAAAVAGGCGEEKAAPDAAAAPVVPAAAADPAAPAEAATAPVPASGAAVAAPETPAEPAVAPITAADILSGPAAEAVIATQRTPGIDAGAGDPPPRFNITPLGVGLYRLGMTRADLLEHVKPAAFRKQRTAAGAPSLELVTVTADTAPILELRVYGARVSEIQVRWRHQLAVTDGDVMVGSTFLEAEHAHGEPRRVRDGSGIRGWTYSELPGVVFAPVDAALLGAELPPPEARIGRIIVLGAENLTAAD